MPKKAIVTRLVKKEKERPFNDEDTEIQITEAEHVATYCRDPLERKAKEDPVIERVLDDNIEKDILVQDEDNDLAVRTRQRYKPQMPLPEEFRSRMANSDDNTQLIDLEMSVRFYTDAIYSKKEMAKVFLMGVARQLRYWILSQKPRPDIADNNSQLFYIRDTFLPKMAADYKELQKYLSPETDLESFRRLPIEIAILTSEINTKIDQMERARQELEEEGLDPLDLESPPWVDYPSKNIINWIRKNPQETEQILNNPEQQDDFIFSAWKELFQSNDVVQFLSFQDRISQKIQTDAQRKKAFGTLDGLLKNASLKELSAELNKPQNKSIKKEMLEALNISKETQHLGLLRTLEQRYNSTGSSLGANVISDPENFVRLLVKP
jgi:hypothetical protein